MTIYKKPDAQAFAENAPSSEIATFTAWLRGLGIAFDETNGFPQMEGVNDVLNRITQGIKYLEQYGIPLWRSDLEYPVGASVIYNGIQYRCIAQNTNAQPDLSQLSWQSAIVDNLKSNSTAQSLSANQGLQLYNKMQATFSDRDLSKGYMWITDANGYKVYLEQWGLTGEIDFSDGYEVRVNFPQPYRNACFNVQLTPYGNLPKAFVSIKGRPDKTGFTLVFYEVSALNQSVGVFYRAIGD